MARGNGKSPTGEGPESRGEVAYARLKEAIQAGLLKPGERIREIEMAERLSMSRTPVREALRRLEADGLLTFAPYRGMVIAELDHQAVMELYQMREVLEGTAAGLAARHASEAEVAVLRDIMVTDPGDDADPQRLAQHNRQFHGALYRAAHNRYLLKTLNVLRDAMALLGMTTLSLTGRSDTAFDEHEAIVRAIEEHNPEAAEAAARAHIRSAQRARIRIMFGEEAAAAGPATTNGPAEGRAVSGGG
ncbi:F0F1 ATP synthase subunit A [alpha proteobacterium BAL199]|jgi:DNA-binding GntR family transcriptional regulator|nr:F0F1 ATP synthase subunit A [alpha proteobacterium BAL199]